MTSASFLSQHEFKSFAAKCSLKNWKYFVLTNRYDSKFIELLSMNNTAKQWAFSQNGQVNQKCLVHNTCVYLRKLSW